MKKIFLALALSVVLFCGTALAEPTRLTASWDANPITDNVIGYNIYDNGIVVGNTETGLTVELTVADGVHVFTVTAYNANGESGHSTPIQRTIYSVVPGAPSNVIITIIVNS